MKNVMKKILVVTLALVMLTATVSTAFASSYTVQAASGNMVAVQPVNVRTGPGGTYSKIGWLCQGAVVVRTGVASNGWVQIDVGGGTVGYASGSYLVNTATTTTVTIGFTPTTGGDTPAVEGQKLYATTALNVRMGAGTRYERITWLKANEVVTKLGQKGNWAKIRTTAGVEGYASMTYLRAYVGPIPTLAPVPTPIPVPVPTLAPVNTYMYVAFPTNVYGGPGTNYYLVGDVDRGQRVLVTGYNGSWASISVGNMAGFIYASYLTNNAPTPTYILTTSATQMETQMANSINSYRYTTGDPYDLRYLQTFYTLAAPSSCAMFDYNVLNSSYFDMGYAMYSGAFRISFRWYRVNGQSILNSMIANGSVTSAGGGYYTNAAPGGGCTEVYWMQNGYLFGAEFSSAISLAEITNYCYARALTFAQRY